MMMDSQEQRDQSPAEVLRAWATHECGDIPQAVAGLVAAYRRATEENEENEAREQWHYDVRRRCLEMLGRGPTDNLVEAMRELRDAAKAALPCLQASLDQDIFGMLDIEKTDGVMDRLHAALGSEANGGEGD